MGKFIVHGFFYYETGSVESLSQAWAEAAAFVRSRLAEAGWLAGLVLCYLPLRGSSMAGSMAGAGYRFCHVVVPLSQAAGRGWRPSLRRCSVKMIAWDDALRFEVDAEGYSEEQMDDVEVALRHLLRGSFVVVRYDDEGGMSHYRYDAKTGVAGYCYVELEE